MNSCLSVQEGYDLWAPSYDQDENILIALDEAMERIRIDAINQAPHFGAALDIGCGTGRHLPLLEQHFKRVVGVDLSPLMLWEATRKIAKNNTQLFCGDYLSLESSESFQSFDFIHSSLALMHIQDLGRLTSRISAQLNDDGILYLIDADERRLQAGTTPNFQHNSENLTVAHFHRSNRTVLEALTEAGLTVLEAGNLPFLPNVCAIRPHFERYRDQNGLFYVIAKKERRS